MDWTEIAAGYRFLEAPRWHDGALWFCDLLAGGIYRRKADGSTDKFLPDLKHVGGIAINRDGRVVMSRPDGIGWLDPETGKDGLIVDALDGGPFPGANDMYPDGKGGLYFGTVATVDGEYDATSDATGLYHLTAERNLSLQHAGVRFANGCGLSPDGSRFYHTQSLTGIFAYDVRPDGSLTGRRLFSDRTDGDGLAVDSDGCVWSASYCNGEVVRHLPDGSVAERIAVPHPVVTSLCFGGEDRRDLYVVTGGTNGVEIMMRGELPPPEASIFHARVEVPGLPVPQTGFTI